MWPFKKKVQEPVDPLMDALGNRHICPDCSGETFTMGPEGGLSQNIKCANLECGSEFCVAPFNDGQWLDEPFYVHRTDRSEKESIDLYGRGYGKLHQETREAVTV